MTELPDDMEKRLASMANWFSQLTDAPAPVSSSQAAKDLRALLLAYQERGRALEAASPVVPVGVSREEIAAMAWRFRGNDRLGGPFYEGAKPTDSPAMADCFAFADAIIAALRPTDTGANHE